MQVPLIERGNSNATNITIEANKNTMKETETEMESTDNKDDTDGNIGDISISKFSDLTNKTLTQHNIMKTENDTHQYYNSTFIIDETVGKKYWVDIDNHPDLKVNYLLSQSHRRAAVSVPRVYHFTHIIHYNAINVFLSSSFFLFLFFSLITDSQIEIRFPFLRSQSS